MAVRRLRTHLVLIGLALLAVALPYTKVSGAWFCGYDDFNEAHRAAFADSNDPKRIFTTTHDVGYMYRPVTSGLQYLTWTASQHRALAFRLRNLLMHLVSVAMLYGIVFLVTESIAIAAGAALLFGLNPIVNENVVVAIWTNSTAYAIAFSSLFLFLYSLRSLRTGGNWRIPLTGSLSCAFIAFFTYEPTIAIFGLIAGYLAVWRIRGYPLTRSYILFLGTGIALELLFFFTLRHLIITHGAPLNSLAIILRNTGMYALALVLPVDVVLAHALFGTPLPSEIRFSRKLLILPVLVSVSLLVLAVILARNPRTRARVRTLDLPLIAFLAAGIPLGVLPLLLFREHPSEHDLYLSAALYAALISTLAWQITRSRAIYAAILLVLVTSFAAGTWVRNERVEQCALIAHRIVTQLPIGRWRNGEWNIRLGMSPAQRLGSPYGIYNDYGLHALETESGSTPGAQEAIQIAANSERVKVRVVWLATTMEHCATPQTCFWVSPSGTVTDAALARSGPVSKR